MLCLKNGLILREGGLIFDDLWVDMKTGLIVDPMKRFYTGLCSEGLRCETTVIDCTDLIVSPGFIDLQFNGGFGIDFSNVTHMKNPDTILKCAKQLLATGVTSFCPTLISCSPDAYNRLIPLFPITDGSVTGGASMIGLHLEGPYFEPSKKGAHPLQNLRVPTEASPRSIYGGNLDSVRIVTLAPELSGSLEAIVDILDTPLPACGHRIVSIGHSGSNLQDAEKGINAGASMITHLFNAMGAFHHRDPGIVGLLGCRTDVFYGLIADGLHAHPSSVAMAYQCNPKGCILVTDAMSALGLPDGIHSLGEQQVEVKAADETSGRKAVLVGTDTLAGAILPMDECIRNLRMFTNCSIEEALKTATENPATAIGINHQRGTLDFGCQGDIVLLEKDTLKVRGTFIKGKQMYLEK